MSHPPTRLSRARGRWSPRSPWALLSLWGAAAACLVSAPAAASDPAGWLRCRGVADPAARLACYDAAAAEASKAGGGPTTAGRGAPAATPTPSAATNASQRGAAPVTAAIASADAFGLEGKVAESVDAITSTLPGTFDGWGPRQVFRLANGQVWRMVEGGSGTYPPKQNPKVTVRRAFMGSFLMEIEGVNQALRVRRVE